MPIISAGLAVIPPAQANAASAFNNMIQRTAGALGVAVFTAIVTVVQAQLMAGRATLVPANTPVPHLDRNTPHWLDVWATSNIVLEVHQGRLQALRQCQTARASDPFVPGDEFLDTPKKLPELNLAHPNSTIGAHRPLRE
jgi:hypothetical protein